ncbi:hypothetical protein Leryth_007670 [Lithospermum erythrorhizon]|nr:hypothetical protein Leryth_007670 [Lithospermum erythrorhizon]
MWAVANLWPFSAFKFDDLKNSDRLVGRLSLPEGTKPFVYAVREGDSGGVIYILCVQNLSERSNLDVDSLIREVKPDAVITQVCPTGVVGEILGVSGKNGGSSSGNGSGGGLVGGEIELPTSTFEVLRRCFLHKFNRESYENVAGSVVLKEIFGVGFNSHFFVAKNAAEEVGASFLLLDSPFVKCSGERNGSESETVEIGNGACQSFSLQLTSLVPHNTSPYVAPTGWRVFSTANEIQSRMVKSLSSYLINPASVEKVADAIDLQKNYKPPQYAQSVYPLLVDLHDIFHDIPSLGRALAHAQSLLHNINKGETIDSQLLSEAYLFRIAVEGLRIALNNASRLPLKKLGAVNPNKADFSELSDEDKSYALFVQALRSQTKKFKSIVTVVDAKDLAGLRRNWNTVVPDQVKDMVGQLITDHDSDFPTNSDRKISLADKPVVAVGAGATAVLGASSLSKVLPASSFMKIVTFKVPASLKLLTTQTQKAISLILGKSLGPSKVGLASSGMKTSFMKAGVSAEKLRTVTHSVIASVEKNSISAMRTAFYEIMRQRRVRPIGLLPLATFGCSMATCAGLLMYGDGIECAIESIPAAPSIANLGRGIQSLHQTAEAVKNSESSRMQRSIESILYKFKKKIIQ